MKNNVREFPTDRQAELSNCSFVKTILMVLVVVYHCTIFWTGTWFSETPVFSSVTLSVLSRWMNSFHIYAFALVSGYLFFYLKHEKGKYPKYFSFVVNKTKRLLIPYAFVSCFWVVPFAVFFFQYNAVDIIKKFIFGISPSQLWFLLMLFFVFILFYPLSNFFKNYNVWGVIVVVVIYGVGLIGQTILPNVFQVFRACLYLPLFWLGFKIRQFGSSCLRRIPIYVWLMADVFLFALSQYLLNLEGGAFALLKFGIDFLLHVVGAMMAFVVLQKIADRINWKENGFFCIFK